MSWFEDLYFPDKLLSSPLSSAPREDQEDDGEYIRRDQTVDPREGNRIQIMDQPSGVTVRILSLTKKFLRRWRENPKGNKEIWESREMS